MPAHIYPFPTQSSTQEQTSPKLKKKLNSPQLHRGPDPVEYASFTAQSGRSVSLYLGDCFAGLERLVAPESVDVVVTSPPYNIGIEYTRYDDCIPRETYLEWIKCWAFLIYRVLKRDGSLFLNIGSKPSDPWVPFEVAAQLRQVFVLQNVIHWIKSIYVENVSYGDEVSLNLGHFKPINSKRFVNDTQEYVFHFTKTGRVELDRLAIGAPYKDSSNAKRWKTGSKGIRCRGNTWFIPYPTIQRRSSDRPHPASFPPELAEMCIKLHGLSRVEFVVDPFLGIGSAAVACARLGVGMIGFEIDRTYLEVAATTLQTVIAAPTKSGQ
ncbi:MAG: site-specific DNA-methyltransferase [Desulfomonilaceae bacterium]